MEQAVTAHDADMTSAKAARMVAEAFIRALTAQDFEGLKGQLAPQVRFRALVPSGTRAASGVEGAIGLLRRWFGDADAVRLVGSEVGVIGDRSSMTYRFQVREAGSWHVVEQRAFIDLAAGRITAVDLLCSGFRPLLDDPVREANDAATGTARPATEHTLDADGATCATLTPMIATALKPLQRGDVLVVRSDDPAAVDGIPSWARLTGNELARMEQLAGGTAVFHIRKR